MDYHIMGMIIDCECGKQFSYEEFIDHNSKTMHKGTPRTMSVSGVSTVVTNNYKQLGSHFHL